MKNFQSDSLWKFLVPLLGIGLAFVLAVSSIMGGLFVNGILVAGLVLLIGVLIVVLNVWLKWTRLQIPEALALRGISYPRASWIVGSNGQIDKLIELAKASLLALASDRTPSGFWGTTYLYRRAVSGSGIPLSLGSLTGTSLVLLAMASCVDTDDLSFRNWAYQPLSKTISFLLSSDGNYILGYRIGSASEKVPIFEPLRHAAGGLMAKMFFGEIGNRDIKTLYLLIMVPHEDVGWTKAAVTRAMLHASYLQSVPRKLRHSARRRAIELFTDLIKSGERSIAHNQIWADPYSYGTQTKNQWMTLWAILPLINVNDIPIDLRLSFMQLIRRFLLVQDACVPDGELLPNSFDSTGKAIGKNVFGTAIATVAWRTLSLNPVRRVHEDETYAIKTLNRLIVHYQDILEMPSKHPDDKPTELEGYFAWAALCLATASVGVRISSDDFRRIVMLSEQIKGHPTDDHQNLISRAVIFSPETAASVARITERITKYSQAIKVV